MRIWLMTAAALAVGFTAAPVSAGDYVIDPAHSSVSFTVRHLATKVRGQFNTFQGSFSFDPADPGKASGTVEIDAASIDTNHPKRDAHLRSADFFDVEKHPKLIYVVKGAKLQGTEYLVDGELTMHGVTRRVPLKVTALGEGVDPWGNKVSSYAATTSLNRKDFGINFNKVLETGGLLIGDDVEIEINVEANPKPVPTTAKGGTK